MLKDSNERFSQFGIVMIGEVVDEVHDSGTVASGSSAVVFPANSQCFHEGASGEGGQSSFGSDAGESLQQMSRRAIPEQGVDQPCKPRPP